MTAGTSVANVTRALTRAVVAVSVAIAVVDAKFLLAHDATVAGVTSARVLLVARSVVAAVLGTCRNFAGFSLPSGEALALGRPRAVSTFLLDTLAVSVAVIDAVETLAAAAGAARPTFALSRGYALVTHAHIACFGALGIAASSSSPTRCTLAGVWGNAAAMSIVTAAVDVVQADGHIASLALPSIMALAYARRHALSVVLGTVLASRLVTSFTTPPLGAVADRRYQARLRIGLAGHALAMAAIGVASVFGAVLSAPTILTPTDSWTKTFTMSVAIVGANGFQAIGLRPSRCAHTLSALEALPAAVATRWACRSHVASEARKSLLAATNVRSDACAVVTAEATNTELAGISRPSIMAVARVILVANTVPAAIILADRHRAVVTGPRRVTLASSRHPAVSVTAAVVSALGLIASLPLPSSETLALARADALAALVAVRRALGLLALSPLVTFLTLTFARSYALAVFKARLRTNGCAAFVSKPTIEAFTRALVVVGLTVDTLEIFTDLSVAQFPLVPGIAGARAWGLAMSTWHNTAGGANGTRTILTSPPFKALATWVGKAVLGRVELGVGQQGLDGAISDTSGRSRAETVT